MKSTLPCIRTNITHGCKVLELRGIDDTLHCVPLGVVVGVHEMGDKKTCLIGTSFATLVVKHTYQDMIDLLYPSLHEEEY